MASIVILRRRWRTLTRSGLITGAFVAPAVAVRISGGLATALLALIAVLPEYAAYCV
ncbi:hypothetical protein JHV675_54530 [Mycobacterium avium subsp. hominissuis]